MGKTNAIRILEQKNIAHQRAEYAMDDGEIDAVSVANKLGEKPERVFKTLVARGDKSGICVFCIPGNAELHPKKAAAESGNKKIEMVRVKELQPLTGYIRGGCSPIGMKKQYPTYIDGSAQEFDTIFVSAGTLGMQILLSPGDLQSLTEAEFADLT